MNLEINKLISEYLKSKSFDYPHHLGTIYATDLCLCSRQTYFKFKKPKPLPEDTLRVYKIGNILHFFIEDVLRENGQSFDAIKSEQSVTIPDLSSDLVISGRIDFMIYKGTQRMIVELKSIHSLRYLNKNNKPLQHHIEQVNLYMKARGLKEAYLVYIDKSFLKTKTFVVNFDQKLFEKQMEKARMIYECLKKGIVPNKDAQKDWECFACQYKAECKVADGVKK